MKEINKETLSIYISMWYEKKKNIEEIIKIVKVKKMLSQIPSNSQKSGNREKKIQMSQKKEG